MNSDTVTCLNGEIRPGDWVVTIPGYFLGCLVGKVTAIEKLGGSESDEINNIHVNFAETEYSDRRFKEIQEAISSYYGKPKTFEDVSLDDENMTPEMLIRITELSREELALLLDSGEKAAAYCEGVLGAAMHEIKLYSPIKFYLLQSTSDEEEMEPVEFSHEEAGKYAKDIEILKGYDRDSMDEKCGLARFLDDPLDRKVASMIPDVEFYGGKFWYVTTVVLTAPLTSKEITALKDALRMELENRADVFVNTSHQGVTEIDRGYLAMDTVLLFDPDFFIDTAIEFQRRLGIDLPAEEQPTSEPEPYETLTRQREDGKTSVLDTLRHAREGTVECSSKPKQPRHKKSEPEI
jgi:hypothetical protein